MNERRAVIPNVVFVYGLLGVIPFLVPALAGLIFPAVRGGAALVLALYGGLILSFLGGARWGFANTGLAPGFWVISLSMLPTLVALALLVLPGHWRGFQLVGLAAALVLHWAWDLWSSGLPGWYPRLRSLLTAGAVVGLLAGAVVLP